MKRATKQIPCPVCGGDHWCWRSDDNGLAFCMREPKGCIGIAKNGGYIHILKERNSSERQTRIKTIKLEPVKVKDDLEYRRLNCLLRNMITDGRVIALAKQLHLSADSLHRLQVGWNGKRWGFPLSSPRGRITGFRFQPHSETDKKFLTAEDEGLFIPANLRFDHRRLFICEGLIDTAAMLDLGFDAIGRPSYLGAVNTTVAFVRQNFPLDVIIVSGGDNPGQLVAKGLSNALLGTAKTVCVITLPDGIKNIRQWKLQGATGEDVLNLVKNADSIKLEIHGAIA